MPSPRQRISSLESSASRGSLKSLSKSSKSQPKVFPPEREVKVPSVDEEGRIIPGHFTIYKLSDFLLRLHGEHPGRPGLPNLNHSEPIINGVKIRYKKPSFLNEAQRKYLFPDEDPFLARKARELQREQNNLQKQIDYRERGRLIEEGRQKPKAKSKSPQRSGKAAKAVKAVKESRKRHRSEDSNRKPEVKAKISPQKKHKSGPPKLSAPKRKSTSGKCNRDMSCVFNDGDQIKHVYAGDEWIGTYVRERNKIHRIRDYDTPTQFALAHIHETNPSRASINGWDYCRVYRGSSWIEIKNLPCTYCPGKYSYDEEEMY
jgi:hypothetical protein